MGLGHKHYTGVLTDDELISLLADGFFVVDGDKNSVLRRVTEKMYEPVKYRPLKVMHRQNPQHSRPSLQVRLYFRSKRRYIEFHRLVWMATTLCPIPAGWEIHHRDEDQESNGWRNLFCLHKLDHAKLHRPEAEPGGPEYDDLQQFSAVPF